MGEGGAVILDSHRRPLTKNVQGWPKLWASFRDLIGILSQIVGPNLAIWANPVQCSLFIATHAINQCGVRRYASTTLAYLRRRERDGVDAGDQQEPATGMGLALRNLAPKSRWRRERYNVSQ